MNRYLAEDPEFVQELLRSLYVDDYASGSESVSSALELSRKIKHRLATGGFNMRKWLTNSTELMEVFQTDPEFVESSQNPQSRSPTAEEDQGDTQSVLGDKVDVYPQILGQAWDTRTDKFVIDLDKVIADIDPNVVTKRMVLSVAAKFYDPLGLISPAILQLKLLFQELCKSNVAWDDQLNESLCLRWKSILSSLKETEVIPIDRCYFSEFSARTSIKSIQLHAFADACETSYGACIYLRYEHDNGVHCKLIASKTRVAPTIKQMIPHLELLSCLVSARLIENVRKALRKIMKIDTVVIYWIRSAQKEYKQFVENRVQEIRSLAAPEWWSYCPTQENPADIVSRGATATQLAAEEKWWHGPSFFINPPSKWPSLASFELPKEADQELRTEKRVKLTTSIVRVEATSNAHLKIEEDIDVSCYSNVLTLLRVTAYVLRFIKNLKHRLSKSFAKLSHRRVDQ